MASSVLAAREASAPARRAAEKKPSGAITESDASPHRSIAAAASSDVQPRRVARHQAAQRLARSGQIARAQRLCDLGPGRAQPRSANALLRR